MKMKAKKGELYNFIEEKIKAEKSKVQKEMNTIEQTSIYDPLTKLFGDPFKAISVKLDILYNDYEKYLKETDLDDLWNVRKRLTSITEIGGVPSIAVSDKAYIILDYIRGGRLTINRPFIPMEDIDAAKALYAPLQKRMTELSTLESELNAIVKSSGSGKIAYHNMIALGVDMTSFVPEVSHLPAVQKLSVDVCVMNGGC